MNVEDFSLIIQCRANPQTNALELQLVRVDTNQAIHLSDGKFLLRISLDESRQIQRCLIRHLPSGREAHLQAGKTLRAFVKDCLLSNAVDNQPVETEPTDKEKS